VTLPSLVFIKLSIVDFKTAFDIDQIIFIYTGTVFYFFFLWFLSILFIDDGKNRAVFIQGSFRSNYAIIGIALIANMFGDHALGKAAMVLAFIVPLYNVLSVIALTLPVRKEKQFSFGKTVSEITTNPIILAALVALPFSHFQIRLPQTLFKTVDYIAALTLPLALLGIGGALNFESIKKNSTIAIFSALIKIVIIPLTLSFLAYKFGFKDEDLGIMFLLFASPTAIVSYIMAKAMGCNSDLAGNIVLMTTLGSILTISLGIYVIRSFGLF
jgi:predicted permease